MNSTHFLIEDPKLDVLAKKYLAAKLDTEGAYDEAGVGELFDKYSKQMSESYSELATALRILPSYVVSDSGGVKVMKVERMRYLSARKTILTFPAGMKPCAAGLQPITPDIYSTVRQKAIALMGIPLINQKRESEINRLIRAVRT
jgi:hypothetical protein